MRPDTHSEAVERAIIQIVRGLGRRNIGRATERMLEKVLNFTHFSVIDAIDSLDETERPPTVGKIAKGAGVDPSRASRMVSHTIRAGYARRVASQEDGRQAALELTKSGEEYAKGIRELRRRYFAAHMKGWSEADCREFARLLDKFARPTRRQPNEMQEDSGLPTGIEKAGKPLIVIRPVAREGKSRRANTRRVSRG